MHSFGRRIGAAAVLAVLVASAAPAAAEPAEVVQAPDVRLALDAGGHTGWVSTLLLSNYQDQLISVCRDKTIRFWDVETGEPLRVLRPPIGPGLEGKLYTAALSPDGRLLAVGGVSALVDARDQRILLIELPEGRMAGSLAGHTGAIRGLKFSPDGSRLASASEDATARVWDVAARKTTLVLAGHRGRVHVVDWSPDGSRIATGSADRTARIWSAVDGTSQATLEGFSGWVISLAYSPDGRTLAVAGGRSIRLFEPSGRQRYAWNQLDEEVNALAFSADSRQLLYTWGSRRNTIHGTAILDMADGRERARFGGHETTPMCGLFLAGGTIAATAGPPGDICLWRTSDGSLVRRMASKGRRVMAVGWSADGQAIGWGTQAATHAGDQWPLERSFCLSTLELAALPVAGFKRDWHQQGDLRLRRTDERVVTSFRSGQSIATMQIFNRDDQVRCYTLLPGHRAVLGCTYGLFLYDALSGSPVYSLPGHTDTVWAVAPSPDGRYLLSGAGDQTTEIWNLQTYQLLLSMFFAGDEWIAWTPEGYYAASLAGESLMGWHVNRGPDKIADFYPAAHFRAGHYRPDVIRRLAQAGSLRQALADADAERGRATRPLVVAGSLPPSVSIRASRDATTSATWRVEVAAKRQGSEPVGRLRLLVDGRPAAERMIDLGGAAGDSPAETHETFRTELSHGSHRVAAVAETPLSYGLSEPIDLQVAGPATPRRLFVLSIGVSTYNEPAARLKYAASDARRVAEVLAARGKGVFPEVYTQSLADAEVSAQTVATGLQWLSRYLHAGDVGVVFLAGRTSANGEDVELLGAGGETVLTGSQLKRFARATSGHVQLWVDARPVHAPKQPVRETCEIRTIEPSDQPAFAALDELARDLASPAYGVGAWQSARRREEPADDDAFRAGLFARAICEGVEGKADRWSDGGVTLGELEQYVRQRVAELSGGQQHPATAQPRMAPDLPIAGQSADEK